MTVRSPPSAPDTRVVVATCSPSVSGGSHHELRSRATGPDLGESGGHTVEADGCGVPGPARTEHMEALLRTFDESGLPHDVAHHGFHAVTNHVLGYTLQELSMDLTVDGSTGADPVETFLASISTETHPYTMAHVHEHLSGQTAGSFELVLDLILDGLVRLGGRS